MQDPASITAHPAIQIKGTRQGLLLVIREDAEVCAIMAAVAERLHSDSSFLSGASLFVDLGWREASSLFVEALEEVFQANSVILAGVLSTSHSAREVAEARGHKAIIGRLGLAKHQGRKLKEKLVTPTVEPLPESLGTRATTYAPFMDRTLVVSPPVPEEGLSDALFSPVVPLVVAETPPAGPSLDDRESEATLYIRRNLRSGARAIYPGHIVVMGDVNPGAELEAEGDIVVIGSLRGKAHAGSAGNENAQIWSSSLQPIQLRIGEQVWVGEHKGKGRGSLTRDASPQKAVVKDGKICIVAAS